MTRARIKTFLRDESGATLVEFTLAVVLMLLLFFALIDFGRLSFHWVSVEKATSMAARIAVVRPPACAGVPETYGRGTDVSARFGTNCSASANACTIPADVTCAGSAGNTTAAEIWARVEPLMPNHATVANLQFRYSPDGDTTNGANTVIGFLGGPYVPTVTVEITGLTFQFVTPLGPLANLATGTQQTGIAGSIPFPSMSVSAPGEDLALGTNG